MRNIVPPPRSDIPVQSPCVRGCCLDDGDTCLGCYRSLEEIKAWGTADNAERLIILENARRRRDARAAPSQSA
jgi:predicted Fe-S protein YdhL (DUF1289 family)